MMEQLLLEHFDCLHFRLKQVRIKYKIHAAGERIDQNLQLMYFILMDVSAGICNCNNSNWGLFSLNHVTTDTKRHVYDYTHRVADMKTQLSLAQQMKINLEDTLKTRASSFSSAVGKLVGAFEQEVGMWHFIHIATKCMAIW